MSKSDKLSEIEKIMQGNSEPKAPKEETQEEPNEGEENEPIPDGLGEETPNEDLGDFEEDDEEEVEEGEGCEECGSLNIETRLSGLIVCNDCHYMDRRGLN